MACINTNHPDYLKLIEDLALRNITNPVSIQAKIMQYQELNGTTEFPDLDFFITDKSVIQFNKVNNQEELTKVNGSINITDSKSVKQGVDFVFEQNPELSNVGSRQLYSQYLDTIFPDSKVKDIVFHGTDVKFDTFRDEFLGKKDPGYKGKGFYFWHGKKALEGAKHVAFAYLNRSITSEDVIAALINLKNPKEIISGDYSYTGKILEGFDGAIEVPYSSKKIKPYKTGTSEVMVRSASQIYILGSEEDIAGFKQFVRNNNTSNNEFDTLFPEYSHLSPEEKAIVMKGVENGDLSISCTGGFKAAHGVVTSNKLGSKWSLVKDLKGYNSHEYGGVDININNGSVTIGKGDGNVEAANGLIIFKV